eukprot:UN3297
MVAAMGIPEAVVGRIVVVQLRSAQLASHFAGEQLQAVVKYGQRGRSSACETSTVECERRGAARSDILPLPITAEFDSACIFLWDAKSDPLVRLTLLRTGRGDEVASGEFTVRLFGTEHEMILRTGCGMWRAPVGQISLRVESRMLPMSEIRRGLRLAEEACMPEHEPLVDNGTSLISTLRSKQPGLECVPGACLADDLEVRRD